MMHHKVFRLLAGSLLLPGLVLVALSPGQAGDLQSTAIVVQGSTTRDAQFGDGSVRTSMPNPGRLGQLNPQPLPPSVAVPLNPQPLPPGQAHLGSFVQLNPQPEPPGSQADFPFK